MRFSSCQIMSAHRPQRTRAPINYAAIDSPSDASDDDAPHPPDHFARTLSQLLPTLSPATPGAHLDELPSGRDLTLPFLRRHGLRRPILVRNPVGLGLRVPRPGFTVRDVAAVVGPDWPIEVLDVSAQSEVAGGWTLREWAEYYHTPAAARRRVLNVITLEFSGTRLARRVRAPTFVRQIDWIDNVFPGARRAQGEFPQVQLYCLMSVAGCWTDWHLDFGGTSVWYHVHTGAKTFLLVPPSATALAAFEAWTRSASQSRVSFVDTLSGEDRAAACWLTLAAGETLVIPSGYLHAVFTPVDSLVFGGNYLHGMSMETQLRVYELELSSRVKKKYRFPFFEHIQWYALAYYAQFTRLPAFGGLLKAALAKEEREGREEAKLAEALGEIGLSPHELRGLPSLLQTMLHLRRGLLLREGGGSGSGTGTGVKGPPVASSGAVGGEPPAQPRIRLVLRASGSASGGAAAPSPPPAPPPPQRAQRIKGAVTGTSLSGGGGLKLTGEDEYAIFPPSEAASEAADMAGATSPEALLEELGNALSRATAAVDDAPAPTADGPAGGSSTDAAGAEAAASRLAMHGTDPRLPRVVSRSLYELHGFQKGRPVLHLPHVVAWEGQLPEGTLAAGSLALPACKLGLYGGAAVVFDEAAEGAEGREADAVEEREAVEAAAAIEAEAAKTGEEVAGVGESSSGGGGGVGGGHEEDAPLPQAAPQRKRKLDSEGGGERKVKKGKEEDEDAEYGGGEGDSDAGSAASSSSYGEDAEGGSDDGGGGGGKRGVKSGGSGNGKGGGVMLLPLPHQRGPATAAALPPRDPRASAEELFRSLRPGEPGQGGGGATAPSSGGARGAQKVAAPALSGAAGLRALLSKKRK